MSTALAYTMCLVLAYCVGVIVGVVIAKTERAQTDG